MYGSRQQLLGLALVLALVFVAGLGCSRKADPAEGRTLFANACARCHGAEGTGGLPVFAGGPSPRNFHDHDFQSQRTDEQLKLNIVNGKGTSMPPWGTTFNDAQLNALVAHIRSFDTDKVGK